MIGPYPDMRALLLLAGLIGLFLGWNLPNHYPPWTTFHGELAAAVGASLLLVGVMLPEARNGVGHGPMASGRRAPLPMPLASRVWLVVALIPITQYLAGSLDFRGDALLGLMYGLGVALTLYVGFLWAAQEGSGEVVKLACVTIVLAGIAASGFALVQWFRLGTSGWWAMDLVESRPYGNLAQTNHFGLLMLMCIVAVTALFETRVLSHRGSYYLAVALFGSTLLICQSRASAIGLVAVLVLWGGTRRRVPTRLRVLEVLALVGAGLLFYFELDSVERALYLAAAGQRQMLEIGPRESIWLQFFAAVREHPWLGYGFGQGVRALAEVAANGPPARNSIYAHNLVLDLMTWFGIPLAVAMTLLLGRWMLGWLMKVDDPAEMARRHWVFAIWLALFVQSLLEFPFAHTYFLLPAALLAGAVTHRPALAGTDIPAPRFRASVGATALATFAIALLCGATRDYLWLEGDFRANRFERANFANRPEHEHLSTAYVLDQLAALNATAHLRVRAGMPSEEIASLYVVARRFHILPIRMDYARALALNARLGESQHELDIIRGLYPPAQFEMIDRDWHDWLRENGIVIR